MNHNNQEADQIGIAWLGIVGFVAVLGIVMEYGWEVATKETVVAMHAIILAMVVGRVLLSRTLREIQGENQ